MIRKAIKIVSIVLIAAGTGRILELSPSVSSGAQLTYAITGAQDDKIVLYSIAAAMSLIAGAWLNFKNKRESR